MAGLNHPAVVTSTPAEIAAAKRAASRAAAPRWICSPGCSVPDDSTHANLLKLTRALQA
jgi:hypothetical protein